MFTNEAWGNAGVDYLVEGGALYKSTANGANWSWTRVSGALEYSQTSTSVSVTIDRDLLENLADTIQVGFMIRDSGWQISSVWPGSALMVPHSLGSTTADTTPPVITLNGSNSITVEKDSTYVDAGATATDNVDGDISSQIESTSTVNTALTGSYEVTYNVIDNAGNAASATRNVVVTESPSSSISIDGQTSDWDEIPASTSSSLGEIKVTDDDNNIYLLVSSNQALVNTQLFLDVDNSASTGFQFHNTGWNDGGIEYMLENNTLVKNTNPAAWAWEVTTSTTEIFKNESLLEIKIPKQDLQDLSDKINIGFINRNASWSVNALLPESNLLSYQLKSTSGTSNFAVFTSNSCDASREIWETDGTAANTHISTQLSPHRYLPRPHVEYNGKWYGIESTPATTDSLYANTIFEYDGTTKKTLSEISSIDLSSSTHLTFMNNTIYFTNNRELFSIPLEGGEAQKIEGINTVSNYMTVGEYLLVHDHVEQEHTIKRLLNNQIVTIETGLTYPNILAQNGNSVILRDTDETRARLDVASLVVTQEPRLILNEYHVNNTVYTLESINGDSVLWAQTGQQPAVQVAIYSPDTVLFKSTDGNALYVRSKEFELRGTTPVGGVETVWKVVNESTSLIGSYDLILTSSGSGRALGSAYSIGGVDYVFVSEVLGGIAAKSYIMGMEDSWFNIQPLRYHNNALYVIVYDTHNYGSIKPLYIGKLTENGVEPLVTCSLGADTTPPVLSLNESNYLSIPQGGDFNELDPGATATDNIDGDISDQITVDTSALNTAVPGQYTVTYHVSDSSNNSSSAERLVVVVAPDAPVNISIDGDTSDWNNISAIISSAGQMKVADDSENLYLLITRDSNNLNLWENTQLYFDVDNSSDTGFTYSHDSWSVNGMDYLLENSTLSKNTNPIAWGWEATNASIDIFKNDSLIEVAIPKQSFENMASIVNINFINRNSSWQAVGLLPSLGATLPYQLKAN